MVIGEPKTIRDMDGCFGNLPENISGHHAKSA
jgi:hypothetical protein